MKPKLLSDVLRQASPRKFPSNRYGVLREPSPADSVRSTLSFSSRSESVKRKNPGDNVPQLSNVSYSTVVTGNSVQANNQVIDVEEVNVGIAKVKSICEKVTTEIGNSDIDPAMVPILTLLNEAITGICDNQAKIVSNFHAQPQVNSDVTITGMEKRLRSDTQSSNASE
jgi:hypothetical protein